MARFQVYANPAAAERRHTPYFVDVQNDLIEGIASRVVVPLRREASFGPRAQRLNPLLSIGADKLVLDTAALGAVPQADLRQPVAELRGARADIQDALDTLFGSH